MDEAGVSNEERPFLVFTVLRFPRSWPVVGNQTPFCHESKLVSSFRRLLHTRHRQILELVTSPPCKHHNHIFARSASMPTVQLRNAIQSSQWQVVADSNCCE